MLSHLSALAVPVQGASTLQNIGFELGLDSWEQACFAPAHCGRTATSRSARTGNGALSLESSASDWTVTGIRQQLSAPPSQPVIFSAWIRPSVQKAPALLRLTIDFEASGANASCQQEWIDLPSGEDWAEHQLLCVPPVGARHAWATIQFGCVRADASLLVDDVLLMTHDGSTSLVPVPAGKETGGAPRRLHFIFGLARDFGGKPFSLVHFLVVRAAAHFLKPEVRLDALRTKCERVSWPI